MPEPVKAKDVMEKYLIRPGALIEVCCVGSPLVEDCIVLATALHAALARIKEIEVVGKKKTRKKCLKCGDEWQYHEKGGCCNLAEPGGGSCGCLNKKSKEE